MPQQAQPRTTVDLARATWRLYCEHVDSLVPVVGAVLVAMLLLQSTMPRGSELTTYLQACLGGMAQGLLGWLVLALLAEAEQSRRLEVGRAWARLQPRLLPMVGTNSLAYAGITLGMLMLLLPGFILMVNWALVLPVTLFEGLSGRAALRRSQALTRGRRGKIAALLCGISLSCMAAWWACMGLLMLTPQVPLWCRVAVGQFINLMLVPLADIALYLVYIDQRRCEIRPEVGAPAAEAVNRMPDRSAIA